MTALTWSPGPTLPAGRAAAAAIETVSQAIVLVGGGSTTSLQLAANGNSWGPASALDLPRLSPGIGSTGSSLLVYGGVSGGAVLEEALLYDPNVIDNVQDASVLQTPRSQLGFATDANKPYALGGLGDGNTVLASSERYSTASDSWSSIQPLPQGRYAFPAVADGAGHIFTFGGATANNSTSVSNNVYRYTVSTNTWDTRSPMPTATRDSAAVLASDGRIYVLGGRSSNTTLATVQSYDPVADTWRAETDLPAPLSSVAAASDALGRVVVIGGYNPSHVAVSGVYLSQRLNVPDSPPTLAPIASTSALVGTTFTYQVQATGNPQPTYTLPTAPQGMTISGTGQISWAPTVAQAGLNNVTVRASNVAGFAEQSFTVRALTPAPTIPTGLTVTGVTTGSVSLAWQPSSDSIGVAGYQVYRVTKTGFHGIVTHYTLYADVATATATVAVPNAGSTYTFVVAAYNASGNESGKSARISATTLIGPSYVGPSSLAITANHALSFQLSTVGNPATFTYTPVNIPQGMIVNPTTGLVSWTPPDSALGSGTYAFNIANSVGSTTALVTVQVLANLPNVTYTTGGPDISALVGQPWSAQFSQVNDPYNTAPVSYSLVSGPGGMEIDPTTGLLAWTPSLADLGTASAVVRATNYAGFRDTTLSIPVYFASAVKNVGATNVTTSSALISWSAPDVAASPIQNYHVTASYVTRSGRFNVSHSLEFDTIGPLTTLALGGLPASKSISVTVTAVDPLGHRSLPGRISIVTATAVPTVVISGGPFVYDGTGHAATVVAQGLGGAAVSGTFSITYNGQEALPVEPGSYAVEAYLTSADPYYADSTGTGTLVIEPAAPVVVIDGGPFVYDGVPHAALASAYALDGTTPIAGSFTYTYEGSANPPSNPGVYGVVAAFVSADPRYASTSTGGVLRITSTGNLIPLISTSGGPVGYDGQPHSATATARAADGVMPIAGTFLISYVGLAGSPTNAGTYGVLVEFFSRDPNYADATASGSLTITPAVPTIELSGDAYYDGLPHPALAVARGVDGHTAVSGSFSYLYNGGATPPIQAGIYGVTATFSSGDGNYADTSASASLTVLPSAPLVVVTGGSYPFTGMPHQASAAAWGVDGATAVAGSLTLTYARWDVATDTYTPIVGLPVGAGVYQATAQFTSQDSNYTGATSYDLLLIDGTPPTSAVVELPDIITTSVFTVFWSGDDGPWGAGVASFDVYVRQDQGPVALWLAHTSDSSAVFTGQANRQYAFYSRARDAVGNLEAAPTEPDTVTNILPTGALPGDANFDGTVGAADYAIWAAQFGLSGPGLAADFDGNGTVGAADYALWAANFGRTLGGGAAGAFPAALTPSAPRAPLSLGARADMTGAGVANAANTTVSGRNAVVQQFVDELVARHRRDRTQAPTPSTTRLAPIDRVFASWH